MHTKPPLHRLPSHGPSRKRSAVCPSLAGLQQRGFLRTPRVPASPTPPPRRRLHWLHSARECVSPLSLRDGWELAHISCSPLVGPVGFCASRKLLPRQRQSLCEEMSFDSPVLSFAVCS